MAAAGGYRLPTVTYNLFLKVCAETQNVQKIEELHAEMERIGAEVNSYTYGIIMLAHAKEGNLKRVMELRGAYNTIRFHRRLCLELIFLFGKHGDVGNAHKLIGDMHRDVPSLPDVYSSLIAGLVEHGDLVMAIQTKDEMVESLKMYPSVITYSKLLSLCDLKTAMDLKIEMDRNFICNVHIYTQLMEIAYKENNFEAVKQLRDEWAAKGLKVTTEMAKVLANAYRDTDDLESLLELKQQLEMNDEPPNIDIYAFLATLYFNRGEEDKLKEIVEEYEMKQSGVDPHPRSALTALYGKNGEMDKFWASLEHAERRKQKLDFWVYQTTINALVLQEKWDIARSVFNYMQVKGACTNAEIHSLSNQFMDSK